MLARMGQPPDVEDVDLRRYLRSLRSRKLVIVLAVVAAVATSLGLSLVQERVYEAEARVLLIPRGTSLFRADSALQLDPSLAVQTEIQILESEPVRAAVVDELGPVDKVRADRIGETLMIAVKARSTEPRRAAEAANRYANSYLEFRRRQSLDELLEVGKGIQDRIGEIESQIDALAAGENAARPGTSRGEDLERRRETLESQQRALNDRLEDLEIEASFNSGAAQLVSEASIPDSPVSPKPVRNTILGSVLGLFLGVGFATLLEALDDSVKTRDDLRVASGGVPVLGAIPELTGDATRGAFVKDGTPAAEAFRSLRTSVQLLGVERPVATLQITSPGSSEGKTTVLAHLGIVLAGMGQRVAMLDCDLRRPRLHELFGLTNSVGFTSILTGEVSALAAAQPVPEHSQLMLVASGPRPPNPSELLSSKRSAEVIFSLQNEFDILLVDSPPVLPVTDSTLLAGWVEATLLVVTAGATTRRQVRDAMELLERVGASVAGTVLNRAGTESTYGYVYDEGTARLGSKGSARKGRWTASRWRRGNGTATSPDR